MRNTFKLITSSAMVMFFSLLAVGLVFVPGVHAESEHLVSEGTITIDGDISDWEGIENLITDEADVEGVTYYWTGTEWTTTNPGEGSYYATTNYEQMLDLINMAMVHTEEDIFMKIQFVRDMNTMVLTDEGRQGIADVYEIPVDEVSAIQPFTNQIPAPADFDHSIIISFDPEADGDYDYYLVFRLQWEEGSGFDLNQEGPPEDNEEDPMQATGFIYAEADAEGGTFSDAADEVLLHTFDANNMDVQPDQSGSTATVEMMNSIEEMFGETDMDWNDDVQVRYDAHSVLLDSTAPASYTFEQSAAASIITGAGPTGGPHVRSFDATGTVESDPNKLFAYAENYRGGVRVATGDIDADGVDEIITGTGENGGPHLRVFEKDGTQRGIEFFPFDESFRGGMDVASGDFDGDGKEDIAVSQFSGGQAWVKVYRYNSSKTILFERNVFGTPECGATVGMGDVDSDGKDELVVGAGNGCSSHIRVFDYNADSSEGDLKPINFFAFDQSEKEGIDVSVGDVDGDGKAEIAASKLKEGKAWVRVFRYNSDNTQLSNFKAYGEAEVGANVELFDMDGDGEAEIVTGAGPGGGPHIRAFETDGTALSTLNKFFAYGETFRGGVDVGVGNF